MTESRWQIIGRGLAGWHAAGVDVNSSGGDLLPYRYWTGAPVAGYLMEAAPECFVYDASAISDEAARRFQTFVIRGPMARPGLTSDQAGRFSDQDALARMAPWVAGGFEHIAAAALAGFTSLDYVTVATYARLLRAAVPKIRIGRVVAPGVLQWADGETIDARPQWATVNTTEGVTK